MKSLQAEVLLKQFGCWLFQMLSPKKGDASGNWKIDITNTKKETWFFLSLEEGGKNFCQRNWSRLTFTITKLKIFKRSWLNGNGQPSQKKVCINPGTSITFKDSGKDLERLSSIVVLKQNVFLANCNIRMHPRPKNYFTISKRSLLKSLGLLVDYWFIAA